MKDCCVFLMACLRFRMIGPAFFAFSLSLSLSAQVQNDTVEIIDKLIKQSDTTIRFQILSKPIDSLILRNNQSGIKKELYQLIFRNSKDSVPKKEIRKDGVFDGKIIRNIQFYNVSVFSPEITDTSFEPITWLQKKFNEKYLNTRPEILEKYLLLKSGERLDVFVAAENERILRDLSFIMDAKFVFKTVKGSPDSVDVLLLTQDKFPIGLEAEFEKSAIASLGITHHNLLGYGQRFTLTGSYYARETPHFGYGLSYGTSNLGGSFVAGRLSYMHTWNRESYNIEFSRNFKAIHFRNAGGVSYESTSNTGNIELLDTSYKNAYWKYSVTDIWAGRIIYLFYNSPRMRSGLFVTGRIHQYQNYEMPFIEDQYLYPYYNKTLFLASTGISTQGFRKDNLIYTFGRTEDVPFGYLFDVVSGMEWYEKQKRFYISPGFAYGNYLNSMGYFYGQIRYGTFLNKGKSEQGAFNVQLLYFSPLYNFMRFKYRNFITISYLKGIERYPGEYTTLSNQGGISGMSSPALRGTEKYVVNLETVLFSPYVVLGFHIAFFGELDLGIVKRGIRYGNDTRPFSGIGLGLRVNNDKLIFNTLVLKVALYPGQPADALPQNLILDSMARNRFNNFFPLEPAIVNF